MHRIRTSTLESVQDLELDTTLIKNIPIRAVVSGGKHPRNLGVLLTLFQPEGADYAHHITASTPGFKNLTTSLPIVL